MSDQKFIYHMKDRRKIVPPKREILKGIYLFFSRRQDRGRRPERIREKLSHPHYGRGG